MGLDSVEAFKIKVRVGDSILLHEKVKENLANFGGRFSGCRCVGVSMSRQVSGKDCAVKFNAEENDVGAAKIYSRADIKNGTGSRFIHDKNVTDILGKALLIWHYG